MPFPRCSLLQETFNKFAEVGLYELEEAAYHVATELDARSDAGECLKCSQDLYTDDPLDSDRQFLERLKLATLRLLWEHHATPPVGFFLLSYKEEWKLYLEREAVQGKLAHIESTFDTIVDHLYPPLPPRERRPVHGREFGAVEILAEIYGVWKPVRLLVPLLARY